MEKFDQKCFSRVKGERLLQEWKSSIKSAFCCKTERFLHECACIWWRVDLDLRIRMIARFGCNPISSQRLMQSTLSWCFFLCFFGCNPICLYRDQCKALLWQIFFNFQFFYPDDCKIWLQPHLSSEIDAKHYITSDSKKVTDLSNRLHGSPCITN